MKINKKQKTIILSIIGSLILVLSISYAYFVLDEYTESKTKVTVSSHSLDQLTFAEGDPISLIVNQFTLPEGGENLQASTTSSATLIANSKTETATKYYNVIFDIETNEYVYTTQNNTPEIILTVKDQNNNNITSIPGLTYVNQGGVAGFDITEYDGEILIKERQEISTTSTTTGTTHTWTATLTFINLDTHQGDNENKSLVNYYHKKFDDDIFLNF